MDGFLKPSKPLHLERGKRSEAIAVQFLQSQGYTVLAANVRYPFGELDIVAMEGDTLCFVEVRSTGSDAWGGPFTTITGKKKRCIIRAASAYLAALSKQPLFTRFDAIGVLWLDAGTPQIELLRGAFDAC